MSTFAITSAIMLGYVTGAFFHIAAWIVGMGFRWLEEAFR